MAVDGVFKHPIQGKIVRQIQRPPSDAIEVLRHAYTAFVLDFLGKYSVMRQVAPLSPGMKVCGPAITSLNPDLTVRRMAIDLAQPGDVLVVAANGVRDYACFGDGTAQRMMCRGLAGAVIDGATRDAGGIRKLGFPTFVLGCTPRNYHYPVSPEYGAVNVPVVCGGVLVNPGDIIFGDDDGVIVIPREDARRVRDLVAEHLPQERVARESMHQGDLMFHVEDELKRRGYEFLDGP